MPTWNREAKMATQGNWWDRYPTAAPSSPGPLASPPETISPAEGERLRMERERLEMQRAEATRAADKDAREASIPSLTPAQEAIDKGFAEDYLQWAVKGGRSDYEKARGQLEETITALDKKQVSGPVVGSLPDWLKVFIAPDAVDYPEQVQEVAQRNLRLILGGQFAMKEGEQLLARAFNPRLDEQTNKKRVQRLLRSIADAAAAKESAAQYYEENGTLVGWSGSLPTMADFDIDYDDEEKGGAPPSLAEGGAGTGGEGPPTPWDRSSAGEVTPATGATKTVYDADTAAVLNRMVQQGRPYTEAAAFVQSKGYEALPPQAYANAIQWQREHPNSPYNAANPTREEQTTVEERDATSPTGTALISAADALTGFSLDNISGALGGDAEQVRQDIAASQSVNPGMAAAGTMAGGVAGALGLEAGIGARFGAKAAPYVGDALYGALAGAGGADYNATGGEASLTDRITGGAKGATAGLVGSFLGQKAGNLIKRSGTGVTDSYVRTLQEADVPLTVGRQLSPSSGRLRRTEERIAGLPFVGDAIKARQREGIAGFDRAAFNRALKPIGKDIGDRVGEEAYAAADDMVSNAYRQALSGKSVSVDQQLVNDLTGATTKIFNLRGVGEKVANDLALVLEPYMTGTRITGDAMQDISRELRALRSSYRDEVGYKRISGAISDFEDAIFGVFRRQAPEVLPAYEKARTAARRLFILQDAVGRAKNTEGVFTPAQLGMAERQSMARFEGKRASARGEGPFHDLQRAGQEVLPDKIPDSGTAGRWILPALLIGGGTGAGAAADASGGDGLTGTQTGLALGTVLALAYSRAGQRVLTKPGRGVESPTLRKLLESRATGQGVRAATASGGVIATTP